jgi:ribosome biogenesis GTPase
MKNWHREKFEKLAKKDKMRKPQKGKSSKSSQLQSSFELSPEEWSRPLVDGGFYARVVEVHKRYAFVSPEPKLGKIDTKDVWLGTMARKYLQAERKERNFIAVGDRVICYPGTFEFGDLSEDLPQCVIEHMLRRSSKISRIDPMQESRFHVIASNMTQLVVVASHFDPKVKWGLIDRYLTLAESEAIKSTIILTKRDLLEDNEDLKESSQQMIDLYRSLGYTVLSVQSDLEEDTPKADLKAIHKVFKGETSLVSGHSGVGKSSLVNLMGPEIVQDVEKDDILYKGRHTTSYASFITLSIGGFVIDTPGVRSFLIPDFSAVDLTWCFVEMRPFLGQCKYRECRHLDEPDCAIKEAVAAGTISEWRYKSYLGILLGATGREGRVRDIEV